MAASAAMIACPPTKEPILETIAFVSFETRSLLEPGTNLSPIFITCGREARK